ncbi:MAG TPA: hypothetical protein VFA33_14760 [Bryobacteraceae bacterium]|nr:hypothetical protein [Bryobacteraceae bacterium]
MPGFLANGFSLADLVTLGLLAAFVLLSGQLAMRTWRRSRLTPAEREQRRRRALVTLGKMGDANLVEVRGDLLVYTYDVRGVEYTASQDVSVLREFLPADLSVAVGPIYVKYDARNPANSIVLSEDWTGLRGGRSRP